MNNSILINNLKQKNKFNPDIDSNFINAELKRNSNVFQYSDNMWKPIIGSISKNIISSEDLKIKIDKPNHIAIKSKYELVLEERNKERKELDERKKLEITNVSDEKNKEE